MKIQEFNKLKVGDRCYLPNTWKRGTFISTEVLKIDHLFNKVVVLLHSKPVSYKYISIKQPIIGQVTSAVGTCKYVDNSYLPISKK
jgi:hypothetical protein